jgi:hypothetical protein
MIPDCIAGIFHRYNPSDHTMASESTQPLPELSTRDISRGGRGSQRVGLTTLPPSCFEVWEPQPPVTPSVCPGLDRDCFSFAYLWKGSESKYV